MKTEIITMSILIWQTKVFAFGMGNSEIFSLDEITENDPEYLIAGGIGIVRKRLKQLGISPPETEIDYPKELENIWAEGFGNRQLKKRLRIRNWNILLNLKMKPKNSWVKLSVKKKIL